MRTGWFTAAALSTLALCACDHPTAPAAPAVTETPPENVATPAPAVIESAPVTSSAPPRGKRVPCTTDQSCNRDPSVSALGGRCLKDSGVCECNAGFELHPGGYCQPITK